MLRELLGVKLLPYDFESHGFVFRKKGKIGRENAWRVLRDTDRIINQAVSLSVVGERRQTEMVMSANH
ncbi:MAG: hypothetical protein HC908_01615 [Calothrix sp. SM1_7_51]|nr:hypothetical protein [Calothrix sp. SM1_7_51]